MLYKECRKCLTNQEITQFHKHKNGKFGHASICKSCISLRNVNRMNLTITNEIIVENATKVCNKCRGTKEMEEYYRNNTREGYMKVCKQCYRNRNQENKMSVRKYVEILLKHLIKKYPEKSFEKITTNHLLYIWKRQNGRCYITNHEMTHEKDKNGNIDTIWNGSIYIQNIGDETYKMIELEDIKLVCHLVSTMRKMYDFSLDKIEEIYKEIIDSKR